MLSSSDSQSQWMQKQNSVVPVMVAEEADVNKKKKKYKLSEKGLMKKLKVLTQKKYEHHLQQQEDRNNRRQQREIRRAHEEMHVSDDSDDEELDRYAGLTDDEKWNRMMNEARTELREEEVRRQMAQEMKRQNNLQNKLRRQGHDVNLPANKIQDDVEQRIEGLEVFKKDLVIMEPLPCVHVALEMSLIGYQETLRFLYRNDVQSQFEKASIQQCQMSVELAFQQRTSPIQVKVEMLWRFAVIMHDFMQGSFGTLRRKYLLLASQAYMLLYDQIMLERERRDKARADHDEEKLALIAPQADWEKGQLDLYWELGALVNSIETGMDAEDTVEQYKEMEIVNNASSFSVLRQPILPVPMPDRVVKPDA